MVKARQYGDDVHKPERTVLLVGLGFAICIVVFALVFWPGAVSEVGDSWLAGLIGFCIFMAFVALSAVIVMGRYGAPKATFVDGQNECTTPEIIPLEAPPRMMPFGEGPYIPGMPEELQDQLNEDARKARSTVNEFGQRVPWGAVRLGGFRLGKSDRWEIAGRDGFVVLVGEDDMPVEGIENRIWMKSKRLVHHEEIYQPALEQLHRLSGGDFVPYVTPLYVLTGLDARWAAALRRSREVRALFLDELGLPGLVRELRAEAKRQGVSLTGPDGLSDSKLAELMDTWLKMKGTDIQREVAGAATAPYVWQLYRGAEAHATRLEADQTISEGHITELRASRRAEDHRAYNVARGSTFDMLRPTQEIPAHLETTPGNNRVNRDR